MGNLGNTIKKFLSNKNTVTILGVIVGVIVLYFGYNYRVKQAITPISIPVAKNEIGSTQEITSDDIKYVNVSSDFVKKTPNLIRNSSQLIGKRIAVGASVPVNGVFYTDIVKEAADMPDSAFADIPDGYTVFNLNVNNTLTYGNSMYPGNYIDLYLQGNDDSGKPIYGKFISSIQVLDAKDSSGRHVFDGTTKSGTTDVLLFAVPNDMYELLYDAQLIGFKIIPVPRNYSYTANPGQTEISNEYFRTLIKSKSAVVPNSY
ncbi:MAG: hypothetical protein J5634_00995 [Bacilli bacterium]|nr:hypothetical protein [Bacilli bacterium]